jgi:hypothetical protein
MNIRFSARVTSILVTLGWGTSTAALTLGIIFIGYLLPRNINGGGLYSQVINASPIPLWLFYVGNFVICLVAALIISDFSTTIVSFFFSYLLAGIITYAVLALPDFLGCCGGVLVAAAVSFTFGAFFPYLLVVNLAGTIAGLALSEHFSYW